MKRTALFDEHVKLKGKIVDFAGWEMPVQYAEGLAAEHEACRAKTGLFDVSHMGEVIVRGKGALEFLNGLLTNDITKIATGQAQYNVMCYEDGGCVDDLIVHKMGEEDYFICVNASNTDKDFDWMKGHAPQTLDVRNVSEEWSQIAIQGRHAEAILQKLTKTDLKKIKTYWFSLGEVCDSRAIIARTGYTGEDGFEVYCPWNDGPKIWNAMLEEGQRFGIKPCGLGARDTLRTEMKYPLYGHEIDRSRNPLEAGLGWVTKLDKPDFIGKKALIALKEAGLKRSLVGLKTTGKGIPRQGYVIESQGKPIGVVTSGTLSPSLKYGIAIASVDRAFTKIGTTLDVVIRDSRVAHEIIETPFYKRPY